MPTTPDVLEIPKKRREHGKGGIYPRPHGRWQIAFYDQTGRKVRETFVSYQKAERALAKKLVQLEAGVLETESRVKVDALADSYLLYAKNSKPKSSYWIELVWGAHLKDFFSGRVANRITTDLISSYIAHRREEGANNGTVNRELQVFHAMLQLGLESTPPKINRLPVFPPKLKENAPRSGFLRSAQYDKIMEMCTSEVLEEPKVLRAIIAVAYNYGLRKSELLSLQVRQLDFESKTLHLFTGTTKSDEGRTVGMTKEVHALLLECAKGKTPADFAFTWADGRRVKDFRRSWSHLVRAAGLPDLLLHDFRRTAARNLIRAGVNRDVARRITGHKTDSIFSRYNIVSEEDLLDAARKLEKARDSE
jgi:integrase